MLHPATGPLADAYAVLLQQLERLRAAAGRAEWSEVEREWPDFVRAFEERCTFEERVLLPAYAAQGREARTLVQRLIEEHAAMRQLVAETARQLRHRCLRPVTQDLLVELVRDHAAIESEHLDPWIALDPRRWSLQLRRIPAVA
jgi:hemerythrin-like domain-containing protein